MAQRLFPGPGECTPLYRLELDSERPEPGPPPWRVEAERRKIKAEIAADLRRKAPEIIKGVRGKTKTAKRALTDLSRRIYDHPSALRRFAESVRLGALGMCISRVYFIQREGDGAIKIGVSEVPERRLTEMQVVVPERLHLILAFNGDRAVEQLLHQAFAPDSIRGEWYRPSKVIAEFMRVMLLPDAQYPDG